MENKAVETAEKSKERQVETEVSFFSLNISHKIDCCETVFLAINCS